MVRLSRTAASRGRAATTSAPVGASDRLTVFGGTNFQFAGIRHSHSNRVLAKFDSAASADDTALGGGTSPRRRSPSHGTGLIPRAQAPRYRALARSRSRGTP